MSKVVHDSDGAAASVKDPPTSDALIPATNAEPGPEQPALPSGVPANGSAGGAAIAPANGTAETLTPVDPLTLLSDRVNSLVKAILERLVPETQRIATSLSGVEIRTEATAHEVLNIAGYAQRWTDELLVEERKRTARAYNDILQLVIYPLHDQLFTRICAMESGQQDPDPNLLNLMQNLEGSLDRLEVIVLRPQPGEPYELTQMESMTAVPCRFFRSPDTVARVHHCGFATQHGVAGDLIVLRKSLVDVYRKI